MSWLGDFAGGIAQSFIGGAIGSFFGENSADNQMARNKELMELQNQFNVENYKHRYQWQMEDMRAAGLNPILSSSLGAGSPSASSLAGVGMAQPSGLGDLGYNVNSSRRLSEVEKKGLELQSRGLDIQGKRNDEMTANERQSVQQQGEQIASIILKNLADVANSNARTQADIENSRALTAAQIGYYADAGSAALINASANSAQAATGQYRAEIEAGNADFQRSLWSANEAEARAREDLARQQEEESKARVRRGKWEEDDVVQDWRKIGTAIDALNPLSGVFK